MSSSLLFAHNSVRRRSRFYARFRQRPTALVGGALLVLLVLLAIAAPRVSRYDPLAQDLDVARQGPSHRHWLGTDQLGRDLWARVIYGGRVSLTASAMVVAMTTALGSVLGALCGYHRGWPDFAVSRIVDILLAFPGILLALALVAVLGSGFGSVLVAAVVTSLPGRIRIIRSVALSLREAPYVDAARALGATEARNILCHIIPNAATAIIVTATLQLGAVLLLISSLNFLGFGLRPPTPEWGAMVAEGRGFLSTSSHILLVPGVFLTLAVLGFNLAGDGLRDALDVKSAR